MPMRGRLKMPRVINRSAYTPASNATSHVMTLPSPRVAGNTGILLVVGSKSTTPTGPVATGWTLYSAEAVGTDFEGMYGWYKVFDGSESNTLTVTANNAVALMGFFWQIGGARGAPTAASSLVEQNTGTTPNPPNLAFAGTAQTLVLAAAFMRAECTVSAYPASYANGQSNIATGLGRSAAVAERTVLAASEDPGAFTTSPSSRNSAMTYAIQ